MKFLCLWPVLIFVLLFAGSACNKQTTEQPPVNLVPRKVRFVLYTDKDFSNNNELITFELTIQNASSQVLWDSVLPPMRRKDIPGLSNKGVVEKWVPGNDPSLLKTGFYYAIQNVGN